MTTITISIDDNNVNITAPENVSTENDVKAAQILQVIDELKEHIISGAMLMPDKYIDAAFDAIKEEICSIMKG